MMKAVIFISIVLSFGFHQVLCQAPKAEAGEGHQYEVELQRILLTNESEYMTFDKLKVRRYNKTVFALSGGVTFEYRL